MNFRVKKFTVEKAPQKKTLMFEQYNLVDPSEQGPIIFWGWFTKKQFEDPIVTFWSIYTLINWENDFFQLCQKLHSLVKQHKEF
jgi:hypothetical protein